MSEVGKRQDQAEGLRTRMIDEYRHENGKYPPRSEIHKGKDKKTKRKMKYPIISILALFFILLPVVILSMNFYYGSREDKNSTEEVNLGENRVYISTNQESDNQSTETVESQNNDDEIESEFEDSTNNSNNDVVSEETTNTNEKQNDKEAVNSSSNTSAELAQSESNEKENQEQFREIKTHKVVTGETLFSIAIQYYNNRSGEEIIRQYNNLVGNEIFVGQTLKIPLK